jgi:hypothetical protein
MAMSASSIERKNHSIMFPIYLKLKKNCQTEKCQERSLWKELTLWPIEYIYRKVQLPACQSPAFQIITVMQVNEKMTNRNVKRSRKNQEQFSHFSVVCF